MVHESSSADIWYHDLITKVAVCSNYSYLVGKYIEEGNTTEALMCIEKQKQSCQDAICMLREEYFEKKRQEGNDATKDTASTVQRKDSKGNIAPIITCD